MIDPFVFIAPVLLLVVVGLLRFLGCVGNDPQVAEEPQQTDAPTFQPDESAFASSVKVYITSPGARVFYTTDDTLPTESSTPLDPGAYREISATTKFRAKARLPGRSLSVERDKTYTLQVPAPPPVWVGPAAETSDFLDATSTDRLSVTINGPVAVGNLIVVWIWYEQDGALQVKSISDSANNQYDRAAGPTVSQAAGRPEIWYQKVVSLASPLVITAEFDGTATGHMEMSAHRYSGPTVWTHVPPSSEKFGNFPADAVTCGPVDLTKNDLAFATALVAETAAGDPSSFFTTRSITAKKNVVMDRIALGVENNVEAKFTLTDPDQLWVTQLVVFRPS